MRNRTLFTITLLLLLCFSSSLWSQSSYSIFNNSSFNPYEASIYTSDSGFHSSVKPYMNRDLAKIVNTDSLFSYRTQQMLLKRKFPNWIFTKAFNDDFLYVNDDGLILSINPIVNFGVGKEIIASENTYINTRGISVNGTIGDNFSFYSDFYETQASFPSYINSFIRDNRSIVPGQGLVKGFKDSGYDYALANGHISYSPSKYFNFQLGHGNNFLGDGYRSLLLSDNSFNYPFLKITTTISKFKYINLFTQLQDIDVPHTYEMGFRKKYASFHYLSWLITPRFNISLFEGIIWQGSDSTNNRGFDINYLNPVILYRPVEFSLNSPDNAIIGINLCYRPFNKFIIYGQAVIDDFNFAKLSNTKGYLQQKYGLQGGFKYFNIFGIDNLKLQTEFNSVRPFTYAHKTPLQNYSHYRQSLAHPLGANFNESVNFLRYHYKRFYAEAKFLFAISGADNDTSHFGNNIFISDYDAEYGGEFSSGHSTMQGVKTTLMYKDITISYLLNPKYNLMLSAGVSDRTETSSLLSRHSTYFFFGLRTSLSNFYYDF